MDAKDFLIEHLPPRLQSGVRAFSRQRDFTELRLRADAPLSAVVPDGNFFIGEKGGSALSKSFEKTTIV